MKERLEYLFLRYLKNASSEPELEEFLSLVKSARYDQSLRELVRGVYDRILEEHPSLISYIDENGCLVLKEPSSPTSSEFVLPAIPAAPGTSIKASSTIRSRQAFTRKKVLLAGAFLFISVFAGAIWWKGRGPADKISKTALALNARSLTKKFTDVSEQKFLVLSDSTQVWLNGNSSLEYPDEFNGAQREVFLSGEAWFDVRNADEIPFIIHTGKITTTVLGTSFNIKAYPYLKTVMVSVSRGKVRVSRENDIVAVLQKGQQVKVSNEDTLVRQKNIDAGNISFWKQGEVYYDDETIGEIVKDLEHINNVSIAVKDHSLLNTRITTSFNRSIGVEQELKLICKLIDKQLYLRQGKFVIE